MGHNDENISPDERRVSELIGSLRHVDAPAGFDARVRSRIASGRKSKRSFAWTPIFASACVLVVLALGAYLALRPVPTREQAREDIVSNVAPPHATEPALAGSADNRSLAAATPEVVAASKQPSRTPAARPNTTGGGSVDEALSEGSKFFPRGVDPRSASSGDTRGVGNNARTPIAAILSGLGIGAAWNGIGWSVSSVTAGSLSERSGLREGDVIQSIDGKQLDQNTSVTGTFSVRTLQVRRSGAVVDIKLASR